MLALLGLLSTSIVVQPGLPSRLQVSKLEEQVFVELNYARAHPASYVSALNRYRGRFEGAVVRDEVTHEQIETEEGTRAVDEAILYVSASKPRPPLLWDAALAASAAEHAEDQRSTGWVGHEASNGLNFEARVSTKFRLNNRSTVAEIISYGEASSEAVVRQLIVDDGESDRGHRAEVFDDGLNRAGIACKAHPIYGLSCVIDLSAD